MEFRRRVAGSAFAAIAASLFSTGDILLTSDPSLDSFSPSLVPFSLSDQYTIFITILSSQKHSNSTHKQVFFSPKPSIPTTMASSHMIFCYNSPYLYFGVIFLTKSNIRDQQTSNILPFQISIASSASSLHRI